MSNGSIKLIAQKLVLGGRIWQFEIEASSTLWMSPLMSGMRHWNFLTIGLRTPPVTNGPSMLVFILMGLAVRLGWQRYVPVSAA